MGLCLGVSLGLDFFLSAFEETCLVLVVEDSLGEETCLGFWLEDPLGCGVGLGLGWCLSASVKETCLDLVLEAPLLVGACLGKVVEDPCVGVSLGEGLGLSALVEETCLGVLGEVPFEETRRCLVVDPGWCLSAFLGETCLVTRAFLGARVGFLFLLMISW